MDKNNIQRKIKELRLEIYKTSIEKKRIEKDYIENGNEYVVDYRAQLMEKLSSYEAYILSRQSRIDKLREELRKQSNI